MIRIKSPEEIKRIAESCRIVWEVLSMMENNVKEGITTQELDSIAEDYIRSKNAQPAFKGYRGFPASICTSVEDEVVHGIPSNRKLKNGDVVGVDVGVNKDGYFGDAARTFAVGEISEEKKKLLSTTEAALLQGIKSATLGNRIKDISVAIQTKAETMGYSVVRDLVGHGVGIELHEAPQVPNYAFSGNNPRLKDGMVLALEPMVNMGGCEVKILNDGWTVVTIDGSCSAHFEDDIAITKDGIQILTRLN